MINHQDFNHKGKFLHYMLSIGTSLVKFEWNSVLLLMIREFQYSYLWHHYELNMKGDHSKPKHVITMMFQDDVCKILHNKTPWDWNYIHFSW